MNQKSWTRTVFFTVVLIAMRFIDVNLQETSRFRTCDEVMNTQMQEAKNFTFISLFQQLFITGCLLCSRPTCDYYGGECRLLRSSLPRLPMYNNLLEFALSWKFFPTNTEVIIHLNDKCYYKLSIAQLEFIIITFEECYVESDICRRIDRFDLSQIIKFNNLHCIYFGIAIYEPHRFHYAWTPFCNEFASAYFTENTSWEMIGRQKCAFDKRRHVPEVDFNFVQPRIRALDGVPVILPCSPGGFAVDPISGRFVTGHTCLTMFGNPISPDSGIHFIIQNIYENNENLIFPRNYNRTAQNLRPMFITTMGQAFPRGFMKPNESRNLKISNKKRVLCDYLFGAQGARGSNTNTGTVVGRAVSIAIEATMTPEEEISDSTSGEESLTTVSKRNAFSLFSFTEIVFLLLITVK